MRFLTILMFSSLICVLKAQSFQLQSIETTLPWIIGERSYGDVKVKVLGEEVEMLEAQSLKQALDRSVEPRFYSEVDFNQEWISVFELPFPIEFNPESLTLIPTFREEQILPEVYSLAFDPRQRYADTALNPAPVGGAINFQVEKGFGSDFFEQDPTQAFFDSFFNISGFVVESQASFREQIKGEKKWFRGDTRIVKDFTDSRVRTQVGDAYPSGFGFMRPNPIGGVLIERRFSIDPYSVPFSQGRGQFNLHSRSEVKTFVNGMLVRNEILPSGTYDLRDLPLVNGLNSVRVEITDDLGDKRVYEYNLPVSISLLNEDEWNFSISSGRPFRDISFNRNYESSFLSSGFVQYGITDAFSAGAYAQNIGDYYLLGKESGLSTIYGNTFLGIAGSRDEQDSGLAGSLTWQWQQFGGGLFSNYTLTFRHERFQEGFKQQSEAILTGLKSRVQANITIPLWEKMTASIGGNISSFRDGDLDRAKGWDLNLNWRALRRANINLFVSRAKDRFENRNDTAYIFLTWTFAGSNNLVNAFRDVENSSTRVTALRDNNNKLYSPRVSAIVEESEVKDTAEIDATVKTPYAEFGGNISGGRFLQGDNGKQNEYRGSVRLSSAFVFAYDDGEVGVGISRPVRNSFALFKPSPELKDQNISLRSSSVYPESASGLFGELTATGLAPYQYREVQIDPGQLEHGLSLEQERFVIYPTYKSVHLISLKDRGVLILRGQLLDEQGDPYSLEVGKFAGETFFTDRQGRFYLEGVSGGEHEITLANAGENYKITVSEEERGIKDLAPITLSRPTEF